ncbi:MAG: hypothetical protein LBQ90_07410, partial [Synergistaceae bacterium]|nr:hypothetical protein [Synergistaceae bacterium]
MLAIVLLVSGSFYSTIKLCGYTYIHSIFSLITMPSIIILLIGKAMKNKNEKTKVSVFFSSLLPLIAIFNVVSTFVASGLNSSNAMLMYNVVYSLVVLRRSLRLFFACVGVRVVRIGLGIVYSIVVIPALSMLVIMLLIILPFMILDSLSSRELPPFVTRTVVRSELSPNSIFLAEIVDADAGATGGSTFVYVTPLNSDLNLFFGTLKKDTQMIYRGRWGEFDTMTLRWESDKILYINKKQYVV